MIRHLLHLHMIHLGIRYNSFYILDNRWFIEITHRDTGRAHRGYINDDGDTGIIRLANTINKAQGKSLEKCGIDLTTDCFPMDNYMLHV